MPYRVYLTQKSSQQLESLPNDIQLRIREKIEDLTNPFHPSRKIIRGRDNTYRIRVGNYRILYTIYPKEEIVVITNLDHRKKVYRK